MTIRDDLALKGSIWRYGDAKQLPAEEIERIAANLKKEKEKTVTQYDLTGKRLNIFPSTTDAAQITGTHFNSIRCVLNGYKATGGFIWRRGSGKAKLILPPTPRPLGSKLVREVYQYNLKGKLAGTYSNAKAAASTIGVHPTTISAVLRGTAHTGGGYTWKRME